MIATQKLNQITVEPISTESDRRLAGDVSLALRNTGYLQLQDLDVHVADHDVRLTGRVPSYYLKQRAHFAALSVPGVHTLTDDIDVVS